MSFFFVVLVVSSLNYVSQLLNNDSVIVTVADRADLSVADRTKGHKSPRSNMSLMLQPR